MLNAPAALSNYRNNSYRVIFRITAELKRLSELEVLQNTEPPQ